MNDKDSRDEPAKKSCQKILKVLLISDFFLSLVMMLKQKMIYVRSANAESNLQHLKNKFNSVTRNWDFFCCVDGRVQTFFLFNSIIHLNEPEEMTI